MASSSSRQSASMEQLPPDVLSDILIRLPAKQLAQMRTISKSFNSHLSQPSFINSHLHRSIHTTDEVLLVFNDGFSFQRKPFTAHPSVSPHLQLTDFIKPPLIPPSEFTSGKVIGSVNGLVCFSYQSNYGYVIYIWNPSLSAVLTLPPYSMPYQGSNPIGMHFRFGYNPKTDDYIVVKLACPFKPSTSVSILDKICGLCFYVVEEWLQVEVYSMRKGTWKLITQRFPSNITWITRQDEVCVDGHDGHIHWLCYIDEKMNLETIVAFDLDDETFREIPLPDAVQVHNVWDHSKVLGVLAGRLCVVSRVGGGELEVWVMDQYGVVESWVKCFILSQFGDYITPFGFTSHNEFLYEGLSRELVLYDLVENKVKQFGIVGRESSKTKIVEYVDSLVWLASEKRPQDDCE